MSDIREIIDGVRDGDIEINTSSDKTDFSVEREAPEVSFDETEVSEDESIKESSVGEQDEKPEEEDLPAIDPPVSWTADQKEKFLTLPRDTQEYIAERERQREKHFHQTQQKYASLDRAAGEYRDFIQNAYGDEGKAVKTALAWLKQANENPIDTIRELMQARGIDPRMLAAIGQNVGPQDPHLRQMASELQMLKERELQREQALREQAEREQEQTIQQLNQEVETFATAKDSEGRLKHPHVADLVREMETFIPMLRADNPNLSTQELLEKAYTKAMRANDKTFETYQKQLEQQKQRELTERAKKAKKAGSSVTGAPGGGKLGAADTSIRGLIDAARAGRL